MMNGKKSALYALLFSLGLSFLGGCGLESYPHIYPIPQSNIVQSLNNWAVVNVPSNNLGSSFTHFVVFYRIYVSDVSIPSTTRDTYTVINPVLNADFNLFQQYIDSDTLVGVNMDSLFRNRGYHYLHLQGGHNIDDVLSSSALGGTLVFNFPSDSAPTMTVGGVPYTLMRSNGGGVFSPQPTHRLFVHHEDLWRSENINSNINADVVGKSGMGPEGPYTYAAMFIVAVGLNTATYSPIYSTPSLIHVFMLPGS